METLILIGFMGLFCGTVLIGLGLACEVSPADEDEAIPWYLLWCGALNNRKKICHPKKMTLWFRVYGYVVLWLTGLIVLLAAELDYLPSMDSGLCRVLRIGVLLLPLLWELLLRVLMYAIGRFYIKH